MCVQQQICRKLAAVWKTVWEHDIDMETKIVAIEGTDAPESIREKLIEAGNIIKRGGLVAFPTETVYGLGGDALNPESAKKIYAAKGRPSDNPLIVHVSNMDDLQKIVKEVPPKAEELARMYWPGPLTMIFEKTDLVPYETTGGLDTVAVRMPVHALASLLISFSGGFIAAPSANISGRPSPTLAKHVIQDLDGRIDMIIDSKGANIGIESTIVDVTHRVPVILRPGNITQGMMSRLVGDVDMDVTVLDGDSGQAPRAPGMKYRHYAPKGELVVVEGAPEKVVRYINKQAAMHEAAGERTGVIGTEEQIHKYKASSIKNAGSRIDTVIIARQLYSFLREFDDENIAHIYSECFSDSFGDKGYGQAVMNRLLKAAGHKVVRV